MQEEKNHIEKEKKNDKHLWQTSNLSRKKKCMNSAFIRKMPKKKNHIKIEKTACSFGRPGICKKKKKNA